MSSKRKQNTIKPTVIRDGQGRTLWAGAVRPGRLHDQTAVKTEGIADLLAQHPGVKLRVDEAYRGLATTFPAQVTVPPRKPLKNAAAEVVDAYRQARTQQSSRRICVEHAIAEHKREPGQSTPRAAPRAVPPRDQRGLGVAVPCVPGTLGNDQPMSLMLLVDTNGRVVASSYPARFPLGAAANKLVAFESVDDLRRDAAAGGR